MRYYIWTFGCQMNKADSAKLAAGLDRMGHEPASRAEDADLLVINTCAVREHAELRAISKLGETKRLKKANDAVRVVLTGCMVGPQVDELRRRFPYVDAFAPPQAFADIVASVCPNGATPASDFWTGVFPAAEGPTAFVPVVFGCNKFCSYCIVPYRRGRERSRPIDDVRREVERLAAGGVREVTLLGQSVEAYGRDLADELDLADLMRALHDIAGLERIRFLTSYPSDLTEHIIDAVAELPKVCESFSLPVQAGDDEMLASMRRNYSVEEYRTVVARIRDRMPDAGITTDLIVGFCGETEAQFQRSYDLLADLRFDKVHVAAYSPRPGTIASRKLADDVPQAVKETRLQAIEALESRIAGEINATLVGAIAEVLVEEQRKGKWTGRTRSGKLVHFGGDFRSGDIVNVLIESASPWSLQGRAVSSRG